MYSCNTFPDLQTQLFTYWKRVIWHKLDGVFIMSLYVYINQIDKDFHQLNSLTSEDISVIVLSEQNWANRIILFVFAQPLKAMPFTPSWAGGGYSFFLIIYFFIGSHSVQQTAKPVLLCLFLVSKGRSRYIITQKTYEVELQHTLVTFKLKVALWLIESLTKYIPPF